ncbi:glycosyltransferase family 4 protein [Nitrincola iocasae]|uniref:glycosyltransferase family 4 protein n=1 Tax=Nitrincola iocasae TaxID=2614693 RepID=UPI00178255FB|nr:glycosyltransferase family 4 protein [Nitrincola iocasae]
MANIYYLIPDVAKRDYSLLELLRSIKRKKFKSHFSNKILGRSNPLGGVKVIYQHCMLLKEFGFEVIPVRLGVYEGNFYGFDVKVKSLNEVQQLMTEDDVVVIPEVLQNYYKCFINQRRVIFVQAWFCLYEDHPLESQKFKGLYTDCCYEHVMCCSKYLQKQLSVEPTEKVHLVSNYIDHDFFKEKSELRVENRVLMMPRKNPKNLKSIVEGISNLPVDIVYADRLSQDQLIVEYQKSDVFIATGYPEGFGLPPLEAMACGAVVIGFTGGGASEFMIHEKTALVANDGDVKKVIEYVEMVVKDKKLKEHLRSSGLEISKKYNKEATKKQLKEFIELLAL